MINNVKLSVVCQHLQNVYRLFEEITTTNIVSNKIIVVKKNANNVPQLRSMTKDAFIQTYGLLTKTKMNTEITNIRNYLNSV